LTRSRRAGRVVRTAACCPAYVPIWSGRRSVLRPTFRLSTTFRLIWCHHSSNSRRIFSHQFSAQSAHSSGQTLCATWLTWTIMFRLCSTDAASVTSRRVAPVRSILTSAAQADSLTAAPVTSSTRLGFAAIVDNHPDCKHIHHRLHRHQSSGQRSR